MAQILVESEDLRKELTAIPETLALATVTTHGGISQASGSPVNPGGLLSANINTPYSPFHLISLLYSMSTRPASMTHTVSLATVTTVSLPVNTPSNSTLESTVSLSTGLPQPLVGTPPPEAFNWQ